MDCLRHLALTAGRALALLAALLLAIVPSLPAHAHLHRADGVAAHAHDHGAQAGDSARQAAADDEAGGLPQPAGDCCVSGHVSTLPATGTVPVPVCVPRGRIVLRQPTPPADISPEALPEPPRPLA